ncbi:Aste57867_17004 [Aphanomyces stellatus]|uniref:Aste57867_17004 protein n=1 Tax=Aphanomyces stellatus TaxID=120398 RepID=A0A485L6V5_9STRA|nr:hypothetical protein As57867_016946 [Aphanomyces stellatus]VFT93765.1 Aste57867_17004 [Aphanomyces stellatus]
MKLPLPDGFIQRPRLNAKDEALLRHLASTSAMDVVHVSRLADVDKQWRLVSNKHNLQVYHGRDPTAPPGVTSWCGNTVVQATLDEVADLFRAETTDQYKDYCKMFATDMLDGATLYTLEEPTPTNPRHYIGIKWFAFETPLLVKNRDFLLLESQFDIEFQGRRGWVRSLKSIELDACPDFGDLLGLVRAVQFRTGHVFLETEKPGQLQVAQLVQTSLGGHVTGVAVAVGMKKRFRQMLDIHRFLAERRLAKTPFLDVTSFVDKKASDQCRLCRRSFSFLWRKKEHCRKCGNVVCSACFKVWSISLNRQVLQRPVCTRCVHEQPPIEYHFGSLAKPIVLADSFASAAYGQCHCGHPACHHQDTTSFSSDGGGYVSQVRTASGNWAPSEAALVQSVSHVDFWDDLSSTSSGGAPWGVQYK